MTRPKIVADNKIPYLEGAFNNKAEVNYMPGKEISRVSLADVDGLITRTRTRCNRELLENTPVKFIASATIGFDHIDTDYCESVGIEWTNAPGCNSSSVEQYIISALLRMGEENRMDLADKTIGIIGVGNVGSKVCRAAASLGMTVLKNDPPRARNEGYEKFTTLDNIYASADIISLHVPLNRVGPDKTMHMVDAAFMDRMKEGAVIINTSRGGVVDEKALERAILLGKIGYSILDVFENEPDINLELLEFLDIVTPHIAGYSADGKANGTRMVVQATSRFFEMDLDSWEPSGVPVPETTELYLDASGKNIQDAVWEVYRQTYDITGDNGRLRDNVQSFEKLRETYPLRREPSSYSVKLFNGDQAIIDTLEILGFSVIGDSCF